MFYDGHPRAEPGAIVCRVAPSFVRFGNFELFAARGEVELLTRLADYTLRHHFPELGAPSPETYAAWLTEICRRTAVLMAHWMRVGFVHGVMNTDNMSILGLTIDYGPFGFLDNFDPDFTPNTTDAGERRYRFANQPRVAKWNLIKLAEALYPLIGEHPAARGGPGRLHGDVRGGGEPPVCGQAGADQGRQVSRRRALPGADAGGDRHDPVLSGSGERSGAPRSRRSIRRSIR